MYKGGHILKQITKTALHITKFCTHEGMAKHFHHIGEDMRQNKENSNFDALETLYYIYISGGYPA